MPRTLGMTGVEAAERERARLRLKYGSGWGTKGEDMGIDNATPLEAIVYACGRFDIELDAQRLNRDREYYERIQMTLARHREEQTAVLRARVDPEAEAARGRVLDFLKEAAKRAHHFVTLGIATETSVMRMSFDDVRTAVSAFRVYDPLPTGERLTRLQILAEALLERDRGDPMVRGLCDAAGVSERKLDPVTLEPGARFLVRSPYMTKEQAAVAYVERIDVSHAPSYVASYIGETYHPRHDRVSMRVELRVEGVG